MKTVEPRSCFVCKHYQVCKVYESVKGTLDLVGKGILSSYPKGRTPRTTDAVFEGVAQACKYFDFDADEEDDAEAQQGATNPLQPLPNLKEKGQAESTGTGDFWRKK